MSEPDRFDIIKAVYRDKLRRLHKASEIRLSRVQSGRRAGSQTILPENPASFWLRHIVAGIITIGLAFLILPGCAAVPENPVAANTAEANTNIAAAPVVTSTEARSDEGDPLSTNELQEVAREDTLIVGWSSGAPSVVTNPWASNYDHKDVNAMMWEGLAYFSIFTDETHPWLAESMAYTKDDFTELTITLRPEAKWSDGTPVTTSDLVYTLEGHLNNEGLPHHVDFDQFVASIEAIDARTVVLTFNQPAPRFMFEVLTLKFDTGIPIVPAHVLAPLADPTSFAGGLEMPHSGPYTTVASDGTQKILDLRADWWAVEAGLIDTPAVKRIIRDDVFSQLGGDYELAAQRIIDNEMDTVTDLRPAIIANIVAQNSAVTTHTGAEPPYGYLDWWPNSLWVNTLLPPYDDARVRRAMSLAIDRDTIDDVVYEGAQVTTIYPFPLYPGLTSFAARDDVQALIEQYEPRNFDLEESADLMEEAGFVLNNSGLWERDGKTVDATIHGFVSFQGDIIPVLAEMLRSAGFDASVYYGGNIWGQMTDGAPGMYLFGHGASLIDPYATLELFHGKYSEPIGTPVEGYFSRYSNPEYDALLDEMAPLASDNPRFQELAAQALEIYWREQIDIPIIQWLHRIPYNQTYWTNWPTADNPGPGVNGAFWAHTGMLMVTSLEKAR